MLCNLCYANIYITYIILVLLKLFTIFLFLYIIIYYILYYNYILYILAYHNFAKTTVESNHQVKNKNIKDTCIGIQVDLRMFLFIASHNKVVAESKICLMQIFGILPERP